MTSVGILTLLLGFKTFSKCRFVYVFVFISSYSYLSAHCFRSTVKWALARPRVCRRVAGIDCPRPDLLSLVSLWKPPCQLRATPAQFLTPQKHSSDTGMGLSALTFQCLYCKTDNILPKAALRGLIRWVHEKLYFPCKHHSYTLPASIYMTLPERSGSGPFSWAWWRWGSSPREGGEPVYWWASWQAWWFQRPSGVSL